MIKNKGFPFSIYNILYQSCICSISQYGSEVYGFEKFDSAFKLHLRAARAFLGLPKNVTSFGLISKIDWLLLRYQSHVKMIQFYNRILCTPSNRLLYKIYVWDHNLNEYDLKNEDSFKVKMPKTYWTGGRVSMGPRAIMPNHINAKK